MTTTSSTSNTSATSNAQSNAALGQSILSGLNAGAGLDTDTLISSLTDAKRAALESAITAKQTQNSAQISSLATVKSDLAAFASVFSDLASKGSLQPQPTSSNTGVMTVSVVAGTSASGLTSSVTVDQLAQAQTVNSKSFSANDSFGGGSLSISVGSSAPITVNLGAGPHSLSDVAAAINGSKSGITASVIKNSDGSGTLVLKGGTGADQSFTISGSDDGTGGGSQSLASLSYGGRDTATMRQSSAAQDAKLTVDGVSVTRSSNQIDDLLPGVSMTLTGTGTTNLSSTSQSDAIASAVSEFVSDYNVLLGDLNAATGAATSNSDAGPLRGNDEIRQLRDQLSRLTTTALNASGHVRTLAELGVSTNRDGTLSLDSSMLSKVESAYPDDVAAMFTTSQSSSSPDVLITSKAGDAASGVYTVTGISPTSNGNAATGSINGVPMSASIWNLTAVPGNNADGLTLQILSGAPSTATITINQGLSGLLNSIANSATAATGSLGVLSKSLTDQQASLSDRMTKAESQVTIYHDQMVTKFAQMNTLVSGYKATQSYLAQQIDLWTKSSD